MAKATQSVEPPGRGDDARRLFSAACERNRDPILKVLQRALPESGLVLEIGAGTGQHAAYFAPHFPTLAWQPSDPDAGMRASIIAWTASVDAPNLQPPLELDVTCEPWPVAEAAAVISINMIHIAPWTCCLALMAGAGRLLPAGGALYLYGPFKRDGRHTAPSNAQFDDYLRTQDPAWGVRDLGDVKQAAADHGLALVDTVEMPANNLSVILERRG
jgi:SAM-dependent methyltransferase